jgi:hypothetical protein
MINSIIEQEFFKPIKLMYTIDGIIIYMEKFMPSHTSNQVILLEYDIIKLLIEVLNKKRELEAVDQMNSNTIRFQWTIDGVYLLQSFFNPKNKTIPIQLETIFIHEKSLNSFCNALKQINSANKM